MPEESIEIKESLSFSELNASTSVQSKEFNKANPVQEVVKTSPVVEEAQKQEEKKEEVIPSAESETIEVLQSEEKAKASEIQVVQSEEKPAEKEADVEAEEKEKKVQSDRGSCYSVLNEISGKKKTDKSLDE